MPRKPAASVEEVEVEVPESEPVAEETVAEACPWSQEELLEAKKFGPAIIGEAMHKAALEVAERTADGRFGPALL